MTVDALAEPLARPQATRTTSPELHAAGGLDATVKVLVDRLGAVVLMLGLIPLLMAIAAGVALSSRGPVLYRQVRYGRNGRPFKMWKFRTMVAGADELPLPPNDATGLLYKVRDDYRVTGVGRLLRRWSLDELPQLWNVLRGDMSLVGPRPLPVPVDAYPAEALLRLSVRPGITGLWQVSGRSDLGWTHCLRLDLDYVARRSLRLDLQILARTAAAVVRRSGAY